MINAVINILLLGVAVFAVSHFLPGIKLKDFGTGVKVALVYSIIDFLIGWLLAGFSLPFIILTMGLFIFVINGFLLWLTNALLDDFELDGCGTAIIASVLISLVDMLLHWLL